MLSDKIRKSLYESVQQLCDELEIDDVLSIQIQVEQPAEWTHGDYSTNIAMQLARVLRKPPLQIAELIQLKLIQSGCCEGIIDKVEVLAPGFINLFVNWQKWAQTSFTLPNTSQNQKVLIEHTSINPNKSAHIGHLRNSCIGDVLARLLKRTGYQVEVHNYIDDLGNQLADTVVGLLHTPFEGEHVRFGDFSWDIYAKINKQYEMRPELIEQRTQVLHALEAGSNNLAWIGKLTADMIVREQLEEMKRFDIEYDLLVWESDIVREGFWSAAFTLLQQTSSFYQETEGKWSGCWVLKQSNAAEDTATESDHHLDKVLVRSNGILTYTAKDIAYHLWKFGLIAQDFKYKLFSNNLWTTNRVGTEVDSCYGKADIVINVIDSRQAYPQAMVQQALEVLGYSEQANKLRHVSYGVVSLSPRAASELGMDTSEGRSSYAMSGRQGVGIKVSDMLQTMEHTIDTKRSDPSGLPSGTIAAAAIRYYLLRFSLGTEVVFDMEQATEITGNTGVYLLYAYARSVSILNKAERELSIIPAIPELIPQMEVPEQVLLRHISYWLDTLYSASKELSPNIICGYAYELASLFNHFYATTPIMKAEGEYLHFRIWLTSQFVTTMKDALQVLGLPTPERM